MRVIDWLTCGKFIHLRSEVECDRDHCNAEEEDEAGDHPDHKGGAPELDLLLGRPGKVEQAEVRALKSRNLLKKGILIGAVHSRFIALFDNIFLE